jgi:Lon-like ATP-dependent protease
VNFPGGAPIDGPSAGIAIFTAIYSAIFEKEIPPGLAMTGEITIKGGVHAVGGVAAKIEAAAEAGIERVLIPKSNFQNSFGHFDLKIITVETVNDVINAVFGEAPEIPREKPARQTVAAGILTAEGQV